MMVNRTAREHGWWEQDRNVGEVLCLIHSEISEALEEWRNGHLVDEVYFVDGKPEGFPIEMADACIRIFDYCYHMGIDLESAIATKINYNDTRSYKHGGKIA